MCRLVFAVWLSVAGMSFGLSARAPVFLLSDSLLERGIPLALDRPYIAYFEDHTARLTLDSVRQQAFSAAPPRQFRSGYAHRRLWWRCVLHNHSQHRQYVLEVVNPFLPGLALYHLDTHGQVLQQWSTGVDSTFDKRPRRHRNFLFPLSIAPGDSAVLYLNAAQDFLPNFNVLLTEQNARFDAQQRFEDVLLTFFFVFCALYLLLSGILASITRQTAPWYYFIYVLLTAVFIQCHLGLGYRYVWRDYPAFQYIVPEALNMFRLVFGLEFFRAYFDLQQQSRRFHLAIRCTQALFLCTPLIQVAYTFFRNSPGSGMWYGRLVYSGYAVFCGYLMLFSLVLLIWILRERWPRRRFRALWLLLVIGLNLVALASISLQYLGYELPDPVAGLLGGIGQRARTFFVPTTVMAAFFLEMVLVFYFSIRQYIRLLEKNQKVQARLAQARAEGLQALVMGIEQERRRIARELHDGACVDIAAVRMQLDALRNTPHASFDTVAIHRLCADLEATYRELRDISHDLLSKSIDSTDLQTALEDWLRRIRQSRPDMEWHFYSNADLEPMTGTAKLQLFRIVQELVGNILKHAQARTATIQVLQGHQQILLTVEDDGQGFDPEQVSQEAGIGIANVRARVDMLQGSWHLDAVPGKGTFVQICIPEKMIYPELAK
jgi:signal transduction histidine kinase